MRYQETWIRGKATKDPFQRECASRYKPIREYLARYTRPFSVFDFGANMGYFAFRIAQDFPHATVIAVDGHKELGELAKQNGLANVIAITRRMNGGDLARLARCEAFDVVLALNVLHHMEGWPEALEALRRLGSRLFVETPGEGDHAALQRGNHKAIRKALVAAHAVEVMSSASHKSPGARRFMYRLDNWQARSLTAQSFDVERGGYKLLEPADFRPGEFRDAPEMSANTVSLSIDAAEFSIYHKKAGKTEGRDFVPGMNLWNARLLGLAWPLDAKERVRAEVARLEAEGRWHDDLRPWNFILSGDRAVAIDVGNKAWRTEPEEGGLERCVALL